MGSAAISSDGSPWGVGHIRKRGRGGDQNHTGAQTSAWNQKPPTLGDIMTIQAGSLPVATATESTDGFSRGDA